MTDPTDLLRTHYLGAYRVVPLAGDRDMTTLYWNVEADLRDPEEGRKIAFSASLQFALADRAFSDPWEREIPDSVMARLESLARRLEKAGLF